MVWIRTTCDWCGDVELDAEWVRIRFCWADLSASHAFTCPYCGRGVAHPVDPTLAIPLLDAGCSFEAWDLPAELDEPRYGPPISSDDLVAMHELLGSPGWEAVLDAAWLRATLPGWKRPDG
jgi:hypothetical protein